ncbi:MAG: hypothetical protein PVJ03_03480 [Chromatiaceae bacterium]|jgi:hypothetical protein
MTTKAPLFVASLVLSTWVGGAAAQSQGDQFSGIKQQLTAEKKALESEELKKLIAIERQKLMQQLQALEALEARVKQLEGDQPAPATQPKPKAAPAAAVAAKTPSQPSAASTGTVGEDQKEQAEKDRVSEARKVAAVSDDVRGILTPRNTLTIEPSLKYTQTSTDRVFLEGFGPLVLPSFFLGVIDIRETDRKTWIAALTARYGITNRLQVEAKVPYVWRDDETRSRPISQSLFSDDVFDADGDDIGDIEFAIDYQLNDGLGGWPFFTTSLRVKTDTGTDPYSVETFDVVPTDENGDCFTNDDGECLIQQFPKELATGTGTWSIQPSLTFLYPTDPAVFYGTVDYSFNLKNDFGGDIGEIDPGDAIGLSGGMGFGINDRSSFSIGFSYKHGFETKQEGNKLNGTEYDIGQVLFGYSFRITQDTNVNLSVGVGTTDDAQDFELNLRVPTNFAL